MPKSAKKRKDKVADFSKAKLKLGKGKQQPTNAIDTSFKARSIALPTQSISVQRYDNTPTTKRKLTFDDLIAHLKHYNAGTRKDALMGFRELFENHPELVESSLTPFVGASVRIIADEDASVRKALLVFLGWLLPRIPHETLVPHSPLLLLFTTSAQTHIFPEIRVDAIRFLDLFLDLIPEVVVSGWKDGKGGHGRRVLEGYLGILNAGTTFGEGAGPVQATSTASVVLSVTSKLVVLRSLSKFLRHALSPPQTTSLENDASQPSKSTWYYASSFSSQEAYRSFDTLLRSTSQNLPGDTPQVRYWKPEIELEAGDERFIGSFSHVDSSADVPLTFQECSDFMSKSTFADMIKSDSSQLSSDYESRLARALHPTLLSTFIDCSPVVFSPSLPPREMELGLIVASAEIYRTLDGHLLQNPEIKKSTVREDLKALLGHMATHFPFQLSAVIRRDIKTEHAFQDLNLIYCELTSLLVLASAQHPEKPPTTRGKARITGPALAGASSLRVERVGEYVVAVLRGEALSSHTVARPIPAQAYIALLPTIWSLLNSTPELSGPVLEATIDHAMRCPSMSAVKRSTVEFVSRLVLLESCPQYTGVFKLSQFPTESQKIEQWISQLPKTLWELGTEDPTTTETILRFLLRLFQLRSAFVHSEVLEAVRSRLVPYFIIAHPTRGALPGPYTKLERPTLRTLALDVVATLFRLGGVEERLDSAARIAVTGTAQEQYWVEITHVSRLGLP
ncbi:hypothetical protein HETIRDRAFT_59338 [Heterobasidion irregulare TC 32-1]|uniref:Pre-rRNA-processing protein n=1 Tax=Heterobasidion irregulare (strain TC 32-1) TaxID=747525 RepID=W4KNN0_HETIT|nr:uncharacterized protein HETIRDRAFT_59338 [Heterobasidion irregulare TC 32-1]ETW87294.1 hypothetical protein HETIRDRAFT_59338 [Heterobasidion irregulare TC 32-1]